MLCGDLRQYTLQPFIYEVQENGGEDGEEPKRIHVKISATSSSCDEKLIQKQSMLIEKLKEERTRLMGTVSQKSKAIMEMLQQMKNYEFQIEELQKKWEACSAANAQVQDFGKQNLILKEQNELLKQELESIKLQPISKQLVQESKGEGKVSEEGGDSVPPQQQSVYEKDTKIQALQRKIDQLQQVVQQNKIVFNEIEIKQEQIQLNEVESQTQLQQPQKDQTEETSSIIGQLREQIKILEESLNQRQQQIKSMEAEMNGLRKEHSGQENLVSKDDTIQELKKQVSRLRKKESGLKKLKKQNQRISKQIESLEIEEEVVQLHEVECQTDQQEISAGIASNSHENIKIGELERQIEELMAQLVFKQKLVQDQEVQISILKKDNEVFRQKVDHVTETAQNPTEEMGNERNELKSKLSEMGTELAFKQKQVKDQEKEIQLLKIDIESFKKQLNKYEGLADSRVSKSNKKPKEDENDEDADKDKDKIISNLNKEVSKLKKKEQELKKLKSRNQQVSKEIADLQIQEENIQLCEVECQTDPQPDDIQPDNERNSPRYDGKQENEEKEKKSEEQGEIINELKKQISELNTLLAIKDQQSKMNEEIMIKDTKERLEVQSKKIIELIREITQKEKYSKEVHNALNKLSEEKDRLVKEIGDYEKKIAALLVVSEAHKSCQQELLKARDETKEVKNQLQGKNMKIQELEGQIDKLTVNIQEIRDQSDEVIRMFSESSQIQQSGKGSPSEKLQGLPQQVKTPPENVQKEQMRVLKIKNEKLNDLAKQAFSLLLGESFDTQNLEEEKHKNAVFQEFMNRISALIRENEYLKKDLGEREEGSGLQKKQESSQTKSNELLVEGNIPEVDLDNLPMIYIEDTGNGSEREFKPIMITRENIQPTMRKERQENIDEKESQHPELNSPEESDRPMAQSQFPILLCRQPMSEPGQKLQVRPFLARVQNYSSYDESSVVRASLKSWDKETIIAMLRQSIDKMKFMVGSIGESESLDEERIKQICQSVSASTVKEFHKNKKLEVGVSSNSQENDQ